VKKGLILILAVAVIFGVGFTAMAETREFTGYSDANEHGYVEAVVTLNGDSITGIELTEYTELGEAKGEGYPLDEWHEAMEVLPERFINADSADIDTYTGATGTSEKAIQAVERALDKAEGIEQFDGTFLGVSEVSERGNRGIAWVTVEGNDIVNVRLEEAQDDGEFKDEDYGWIHYHFAQNLVAEAFEILDRPDVDTYSGATGSSERWIEAVNNALDKAGWDK